MLEIYGILLSQLPDHGTLAAQLRPDFYGAWLRRHADLRQGRRIRASLGGLLLLQMSGKCGEIVYGPNSRPYFREGNLDFNVTHTDDLVLCAVHRPDVGGTEPQFTAPSPKWRVGLDAEPLGRVLRSRIYAMAERWFSEPEAALFRSDPTELCFLQIWTRKEALSKWTGQGLHEIRSLNTVSAAEDHGVRFYEYRVENTLVTLCCHSDVQPPQSVRMLTYSQLLQGSSPIS